MVGTCVLVHKKQYIYSTTSYIHFKRSGYTKIDECSCYVTYIEYKFMECARAGVLYAKCFVKFAGDITEYYCTFSISPNDLI